MTTKERIAQLCAAISRHNFDAAQWGFTFADAVHDPSMVGPDGREYQTPRSLAAYADESSRLRSHWAEEGARLCLEHALNGARAGDECFVIGAMALARIYAKVLGEDVTEAVVYNQAMSPRVIPDGSESELFCTELEETFRLGYGIVGSDDHVHHNKVPEGFRELAIDLLRMTGVIPRDSFVW